MRIGPQRPVNPDAIVAPPGYRVEALVVGLSFPSSISFGPGGELYLAESGGVGGQVVAVPRILRIDPDRSVNEIGRLDNPIVGVVYRNGELLIAEDGYAPRILKVTTEGELLVLVQGLPGGGDYGLSGLALDASGGLLFGLGTRTNSGVVGLDNFSRRWVSAHPEWADVPGADVELAGVNYVTSVGNGGRAVTGGWKAFGHRAEPGERARGAERCGGAVYRLAPDSTEPERLAWGLRNPIGVQAAPDGRVLVTEGGMEERGSRPIANAPDSLWAIRAGGYYGWPDYAAGIPVSDPRFRLPGHPQPRPLAQNAPAVAGTPLATFAPRSGVGRFDFSDAEEFGFVGDAFVALSGEWSAPAYANGDAPTGHRVVRVDPRNGNTTDFLVNRQPGPSSASNGGGLERPVDVRFDPTGEVLYVLDLGEVHLHRENGLEPFGGTGVLWRITPERLSVTVSREIPTEAAEEVVQVIDTVEAVEGEEVETEPETTGSSVEIVGAETDAEGDPEASTEDEPEAEATTPDAETAAILEDRPGEPVEGLPGDEGSEAEPEAIAAADETSAADETPAAEAPVANEEVEPPSADPASDIELGSDAREEAPTAIAAGQPEEENPDVADPTLEQPTDEPSPEDEAGEDATPADPTVEDHGTDPEPVETGQSEESGPAELVEPEIIVGEEPESATDAEEPTQAEPGAMAAPVQEQE